MDFLCKKDIGKVKRKQGKACKGDIKSSKERKGKKDIKASLDNCFLFNH